MKIFVRRSEYDALKPVELVETARGKEARGVHLLGIVNEAGQLVIKLRGEYLIVEDSVG
jgi:hypothetical protein